MAAAVFSVRDMFGGASDSDDEATGSGKGEDLFAEREVEFPGRTLSIREFSFHSVNANLVWPGCQRFAAWLKARPHLLSNRNVLEIGSGTGALAIYLSLDLGLHVTTCDYDDVDIEANIRHNCEANGVPPLDHIRHTWGEPFPISVPRFDLILASDILLYVKQYPNLVKTINFLLRSFQGASPGSSSACDQEELDSERRASTNVSNQVEDGGRKILDNCASTHRLNHLPRPCFLMSWRRRLPTCDEQIFFSSCREVGLEIVNLGSRVYSIFVSTK